MAHAIPFDTLAFAKKLELSGLGKQESEAIAEAVVNIFDNNLNSSATKHDLQGVKAELKQDIHELKAELVKWVVSLMFAQTTILVAIMVAMKFVH
ncbi:MAG: DUF1640 domain-containing protein [Gammaproteobacteria bacterium]